MIQNTECECEDSVFRKANVRKKNSAKRDTRPLRGHDLTINVHHGGIPKDHIIEKVWSV